MVVFPIIVFRDNIVRIIFCNSPEPPSLGGVLRPLTYLVKILGIHKALFYVDMYSHHLCKRNAYSRRT